MSELPEIAEITERLRQDAAENRKAQQHFNVRISQWANKMRESEGLPPRDLQGELDSISGNGDHP